MAKNEKTFDNWSAALVSREARAPRAGQDRKPCMVNELRLISLLIMARRAGVARRARAQNAQRKRMRLSGTGRGLRD